MQPEAARAAPLLETLREALTDFHEAVAQAHQQAIARTLAHTARQLHWLAILAHEVSEDAWNGRLARLQERLSAGSTAPIESWPLSLPALAQEARGYWQGPSFPETAADLLTRRGGHPDDLPAPGQALALFFDELARAVRAAPSPSDAGEAGGERP